jgi:hypothetical protein
MASVATLSVAFFETEGAGAVSEVLRIDSFG